MTFDEHRTFHIQQVAHLENVGLAKTRQLGERIDATVGDFFTLRWFRPTRKRETGKVTRQAYASTQYHCLLGAQHVGQFIFSGEDILNGHKKLFGW